MYILFILAFGLGFYVSFHKLASDDNNSVPNSTEGGYEPFETGLQSFIKTSAMFSGELVSNVGKLIFRK